MPLTNNVTLKTYFETGDVPTEAQFIELLDTVHPEAFSHTHAQMLTNIAGSLLIPGKLYYISDKAIYIKAHSVNKMEFQGIKVISTVPYYVEYNTPTDKIIRQVDSVYNVDISITLASTNNCITNFPWGSALYYNVKGVDFDLNITDPTVSYIRNTTIESGVSITLDNGSNITDSLIGTNAAINLDTASSISQSHIRGDVTADVNSSVGNSNSGAGSLILLNDGIFSNSTIGSNAAISVFGGVYFTSGLVGDGANIVLDTTTLANCIIGSGIATTFYGGATHTGKTIISGLNTFEATVNLATALAANVLTIPNSAKYAGILNLTSANATETITDIGGIASGLTYEFRPETGLDVTWSHTAATGIAANKLAMPASTNTNGSTKESITFKRYAATNGNYQVGITQFLP